MNGPLPKGFKFASVHAGVKHDNGKLDISLFISDRDATAAGVFTTNRLCAAPVHSCRRRLPGESIRGIVVNSGNANACTGQKGQEDAERMCAQLARKAGCAPEQILVASTGVIGRLMPMEKIIHGIERAYDSLAEGPDALTKAATGIMTTDTRTKIFHRTVELGGKTAVIAGVAKGAAMIGPNMATMLGFVLTDAVVPATLLDSALRSAVDDSFHCISVEGHMSTNDTVLLVANGASGAKAVDDTQAFGNAVSLVCQDLAQAIINDAEGASHVITIDVTGARSDADAHKIAKTVADSALVKTAFFGNDPNWGRICSAAGYAGIPFEEEDLSLRVNGVLLYDHGAPTAFDPAAESARMKANRDVHVELIFTLGSGRRRYWTCDLTNEYVHLNADYTT